MELKKKSIKIIKSLILANGGILATYSNGAYPYVYPRDAVIMTKALNSQGYEKLSEKFYYFIKKYSNLENYSEIFHRYNSNGLPCVTRKNENDNPGLIIHGIYQCYKTSKNKIFLEDMWLFVKEIVKLILSYQKNQFGLVKTKRSIHEFFRLENGYEIWSNCACCRGLIDASKIAETLGYKNLSKDWKSKALKLKESIEKNLFNKKLGMFVKNKKFPNVPDISQLSPFYFELCNSKKILKQTLKYLEKTLWDKKIGGFKRFRKFEICKDWHWYTGGDGSWVVFTLWAAKFYRILGDKKNERKCLNWVKSISKKTNCLLPEHLSTKEEYLEWERHEIEFNKRIINEIKKLKKGKLTNLIYWALPLGWSHAEYLLK